MTAEIAMFDLPRATIPVALDGKRCPRCGERKPAEGFHRNKKAPDGMAFYCKPCMAGVRRLHYYGLTPEGYRSLSVRQQNACAICGIRQDEVRLPFAVDHDHRCCKGPKSCGSCIRGLICDSCNRGIGFLGDSPERLLAAARYLTHAGLRHDRPSLDFEDGAA